MEFSDRQSKRFRAIFKLGERREEGLEIPLDRSGKKLLIRFRWFILIGHPLSPRSAQEAAYCGSIETLDWLKTNSNHVKDRMPVHLAVATGHIDTVKWLWANRYPSDDGLLGSAAAAGQLDMIKWLLSIRYPSGNMDAAIEGAATNGHIEVILHLSGIHRGRNAKAITVAAEGNHLEAIKVLRELGYTWDHDTMAMAAHGGHLELVKWLVAAGCPWDPRHVARFGRYQVMRWLKTQRPPRL